MGKIKYIDLANLIKYRIELGQYKDKIPSELELAKELEYSRQTVRNAYDILEAEEYIIKQKGSGTYINKDKIIPQRSTKQIGIITTYISDYIFPDILRGIESELSKSKYSILLSSTYNSVANERKILEEYIKFPPAGLIIEGTKTALPNPNIYLYEKLISLNVPMIFINGYYKELGSSISVIANDEKGAEELVNYLVSKKYTKIAGIFKSDDMQGIERYKGYINGLCSNNLEIKDENIEWFTTESKKNLIKTNMLPFIEKIKTCDALICYNDEIALPFKTYFEKNKIKIELVSFDHSSLAKLSGEKFLSISHPKENLGKRAVQKLISVIHGREEVSEKMNWRFPSDFR